MIRNGDVKQVINYSKEYALAVVPVSVAYDADLRSVFRVLRDACDSVRAENGDTCSTTPNFRASSRSASRA